MKKLLIFGSSISRDLKNFDTRKFYKINGVQFKFIYRDFSGKSFEHFLKPKNHYLLDSVLSCRPDYVLVIFGGNSINAFVERDSVLDAARDFYSLLNEKLSTVNPNGKIIASQVPLRFVRKPNKHNTPPPDEYAKFRKALNKKINCLRSKHHMLVIGGPGNLDSEEYFRDGIHFTDVGQEMLLNIILSTLSYILNRV